MFFSTLLAALVLSPAADAGASASSFKKENKKGANFWNAQSAIDGDKDTAWMVPGDSSNMGEWMMFDVPKSDLDKIGLYVGYVKTEDTFKDFARVKAVRVEVFNFDEANDLVPAGSATASFEDKMDWQVIDIADMKIGSEMVGGRVKVTVTEVFPGRDYPNLAVSEMLLYLKEFDATPMIHSASSEDPSHDAGSLVDESTSSYWAASEEGEVTISFEAVGYSLSKVGLEPGPKNYGRPKTVEISANGRTSQTVLKNDGKTQWLEIPPVTGFTGSAWGEIELKIIDTYPGTGSAAPAVSELKVKATAYEGI